MEEMGHFSLIDISPMRVNAGELIRTCIPIRLCEVPYSFLDISRSMIVTCQRMRSGTWELRPWRRKISEGEQLDFKDKSFSKGFARQ